MSWLLAIAFASSAALLVAGLGERSDPKLRRAMPADDHERPGPGDLIGWLGRRLPLTRARAVVVRRLDGSDEPFTADRILGAKALLAAGGFAAGLVASPRGFGAVVATIVGAAGFRLPDFVLARRQSARRARSLAAVPDVLEIVAVCATAGLTPRVAVDRASSVVEGPLAPELSRVRRETELGVPWRAALRSAAERTGSGELRRLVVVLERSERLGAPVAERLRDLAREVRAERRAREEERASRAPVLMLFPLVFLILPAFVLAAVVPALLVAARGIQ